MAYPIPQSERITLTGASGAKYEFELYLWGTEFRPIGALYTVLRRDPDAYRVIYVGETSDMSVRCDCHHQLPCFTRNRMTHIAVRAESDRTRRLLIEADLRRSYNPPCNEQ